MSLPNLKEFITRTLVDIGQAVSDAAEQTKKIPHHMDSITGAQRSEIKFDLAVTTSDANTQSANGGVGFNIQVLKAKLGGDLEQSSNSESVSRISFAVPMCFSVREESK